MSRNTKDIKRIVVPSTIIINSSFRPQFQKTCGSCGTTHDRDILAANNILKFAFQKQNLIGEGIAEFKPVEHGAVASAVKQECNNYQVI